MPSVDWIESNLGRFTGRSRLLNRVWRMDVCTSDRYFTVMSFFLLDLLPKRTSFDKILVDTRVVSDSTTPCFDTTETIRGLRRRMEVFLHKAKLNQLLDNVEARLLVILGFAPKLHSSDAFLSTPGDQL